MIKAVFAFSYLGVHSLWGCCDPEPFPGPGQLWTLELEKVVVISFTAKEVRDFQKREYVETCSICTEIYSDNDLLTMPKCMHYMHQKCLAKWHEKSQTCPMCRA